MDREVLVLGSGIRAAGIAPLLCYLCYTYDSTPHLYSQVASSQTANDLTTTSTHFSEAGSDVESLWARMSPVRRRFSSQNLRCSLHECTLNRHKARRLIHSASRGTKSTRTVVLEELNRDHGCYLIGAIPCTEYGRRNQAPCQRVTRRSLLTVRMRTWALP